MDFPAAASTSIEVQRSHHRHTELAALAAGTAELGLAAELELAELELVESFQILIP